VNPIGTDTQSAVSDSWHRAQKTPKGTCYLSAITAAKTKIVPADWLGHISLTRDFGVDPLRVSPRPIDALGRSVQSCHGRSRHRRGLTIAVRD
jgi:hypothetical protein